MKDRAIELKVGIFVAVGVALLVLSIFAITGDRAFFAEKYTLKVRFNQVIGLGPGSVVQVLGFPVGNVEAIHFDPNSSDLIVSMKIYSEFQKRIPADSKADVRTKGALGDKYIYIEPGVSSEFLAHDAFVTAKQEPDILNILASKGGDIDRIFSIIAKIDQMLSDVNDQGQVREMVKSLQVSLRNLESISSKLSHSKLDENLVESIEKLTSVLNKIDSGKGSLGALINDPAIHNSLKRILGAKSLNTALKNQIRSSIKESEKLD